MTNLKTTIKTLSIAAAVSFSMNAMAITVTNLGSGFDSSASAGSGLGHDALGNMNSILSSFAGTGGAAVDSNMFFRAFIGTQNKTYFDFVVARPMIEELIYTVDHKTFESAVLGEYSYVNGNKYVEQADGSYLIHRIQADGTFIAGDGSNATDVVDRNYVQGHAYLSETVAPVAAHYEIADSNADGEWATRASLAGNGGFAVNGDIRSSFNAGKDVLARVGLTGFDSTGTENTATDVLNTVNGGATVDVSSARVVVAAYDNANDLIQLIADENKTGKALDVAAAANGLQTMITMHNGFLSATVRQEAIALKAALKNMGIQTAASAVGQGALEACDNQFADGVTVDLACTAIGTQFSTLAGQISTADAGDYNTALGKLETYANNIIAFNTGAANGYDSANAAAEITSEFGIITSTLDQTTFGDDFGNAVNSGLDGEINVDGDYFEFTIGTANGTGSITK